MMISARFYDQMTEADRETVPMTYYIRWDDESWETGDIELSRLEAEELNQESAAYVADYIYHHGTTEKSFFNEYSPIQPDESDLYINKIYIKCGADIVTWFGCSKDDAEAPNDFNTDIDYDYYESVLQKLEAEAGEDEEAEEDWSWVRE